MKFAITLFIAMWLLINVCTGIDTDTSDDDSDQLSKSRRTIKKQQEKTRKTKQIENLQENCDKLREELNRYESLCKRLENIKLEREAECTRLLKELTIIIDLHATACEQIVKKNIEVKGLKADIQKGTDENINLKQEINKLNAEINTTTEMWNDIGKAVKSNIDYLRGKLATYSDNDILNFRLNFSLHLEAVGKEEWLKKYDDGKKAFIIEQYKYKYMPEYILLMKNIMTGRNIGNDRVLQLEQ